MRDALKRHWPEYLMEAAELAAFMVSACVVVALLSHPASPAVRLLPNQTVRRVLTGIAMGLTAIAIVYSPWGKQSGAHFNPAVTLTFLRLGKIAPWDAAFYMVAQCVGGCAGVVVCVALLGDVVRDPSVGYVATVPGPAGVEVAFLAELLISFGLMSVVLTVSNTPRIARFTGVIVGAVVALFISIEGPLSGMSMNPARTLGPALVGHIWTALWVYFIAPPLGMLLAAEVYGRVKDGVGCAKLHHDNPLRCIFCEHHTEPRLIVSRAQRPLAT